MYHKCHILGKITVHWLASKNLCGEKVNSLSPEMSQDEIRTLIPSVPRATTHGRSEESQLTLIGSLSIASACLVGMSAAMMIEYMHKPNQLPLESSLVVSTVLMLMGIGTSERFYYMTTVRMLGILIGVAIGMTLAIIETFIESTYKAHALIGKGHLGVHDLDWVLIIYRCVVLSPIIFICSIYMRNFERYSTAFLMVAMQCACTLLSPSLRDATAVAAGSLLALLVSTASMFTFRKYTSESLLLSTHKRAFDDVMGILQLALRADIHSVGKFEKYAEEVEDAIAQSATSFDQYKTWRAWTGREMTHDFGDLIKVVRSLYYQCYSLYWANAGSVHAEYHKARYWFCDNMNMFDTHFKRIAQDLWESVESIKVKTDEIYESKSIQNNPELLFQSIHTIIHTYIRDSLVNGQKDLHNTFISQSSTCFSTSSQRWSMTDYLQQLSLITIAIIEYMQTLVVVFEKNTRFRDILLTELEYLAKFVPQIRDHPMESTIVQSVERLSDRPPQSSSTVYRTLKSTVG
jgi:hypothetical protein